MDILRQGLHLESEQRIIGVGAVYLGCRHIVASVRLLAGTTVTTMTYDIEDFLKSRIARYRAVVGVNTPLRNYATPCWPRTIGILLPELPAMDRSKSALGVTTRDLRLHSVVTRMRNISSSTKSEGGDVCRVRRR